MILVTSYYNPCKYKIKKINYKKFKKNIELNKINLITFELAPSESDFEIEDSIKFIGNPLFWPKENLLSQCLKLYPQEDKIAWVDCDIIFENNNWFKETEEKLEKYDVLQLFEEVNFLKKTNLIEKKFKSTIFEFYGNKNFKDGFPNQGHPGFAWAAKRKYFNFYRENFVFSSDVIYASSITKNYWIIDSWKIDKDLKTSIIYWCQQNNNNAKFGNIKGHINHLWHGSWQNRQYNSRMSLLNYYKEIKLENNFFECKNKKIIDIFHKFYKKRNEDGIKL
jgi:hypothetical protein